MEIGISDILGTRDLEFGYDISVYYDFSKDEIINSDGSIAEFKMNYGDYDILNEKHIKLINKITKGNTIPILDYFKVQDGNIFCSNLSESLIINSNDLENGIYFVKNGAIIREQSLSKASMDDYPNIQELINEDIKFIISSEILKKYLKIAFNFIGNDKYRPKYNGVNIELRDGKINLAATNGHILYKQDISKYVEFNSNQKEFSIILREDNVIDYLNNTEESPLILKSDGKYLTMQKSDSLFLTKLIDDKYMAISSVIPAFSDKIVSFNNDELKKIINSNEVKSYINKYKKSTIALFDVVKDEKYTSIHIGVSDNKLITDELYLGDIEYDYSTGNYQTKSDLILIMPIFKDEHKISHISFDIKYLKTVISSTDCDKISFEYSQINRAYIVPQDCLFKKTDTVISKKHSGEILNSQDDINHSNFVKESKNKSWEIVDNEHKSDYGYNYFSTISKENPIFETISIDESGNDYVSVGFINGEMLIIGDRYDFKSPIYKYDEKRLKSVDDLIKELDSISLKDKNNEIEELETLIELLKEVVAENPKDLDSKDALELYEETLAELKKVNSEKFAKGGKVSDYHDVPYWTYRGSNASDRIFGTLEEAEKELNKKRKEDYYKSVPETLIIVNVPADERLNIPKRYMVIHLEKDYKYDKNGMISSYEKGGSINSDLENMYNHIGSKKPKEIIVESGGEKIKYNYYFKNNPEYYVLEERIYDANNEDHGGWEFIGTYGSSNEWDVKHAFKFEMDKILNRNNFEKGGDVGCGCKHSFAKGGEVNSKKVIRRNLPINKEYKLVDSFYTGGIMENPMSCENCGRPIANVAVIEDEDGRKYDVGMDCAETLSQIKNSLEFNMAQNDFAEANAIRTKVKNALKKYPDAKLTIDNTYYGTVNIHVRNDRGIYVNSNLPKEFAFKYLPEFKNKISNPEKNGYMPRYKDNIKLDIDVASFKDKNASTKEVKFDDYKVIISREDRPNYNTETGEIRNYNNYIIVKVFKGEELIGERSFYMASDIVPKIISIINEYDFENFKEQFKYGGYIQSLSYSEILKRLKDEFGIDESDGKSIHGSDLMRIIQLDKNIDSNAGMNLAKVLTDNGWTIIRDKYEQGGLLESNGAKYFSKDFESKGNTWNILFVWGKFNYVSVSKKTNNPFRSGVGKEFKNVDEAIAYYKNPDMKVQLIFAENEAKELGYMSAFQNGGKLPESFIEKTYGDLHEEKGIITTKSNWLDKDGIKRLQYGFDPFRDEDSNTLFYYSWDFRDSGLSYDEFRNKLKDFFSSKYGKTVNKLTSLYVGWDRKEKGTYEKGGEIGENELYYAVYDDNTLGLLFLDEIGNKRFLVLQGSTLRGSNYSHMSMPLYINEDELSKIRKATEKDFDIYRVSLPPDFNKLNSQENLKGMIKKGDVVLFKCEGSEAECRGEILDTLSSNEYLVSKGIKSVIVPKEKVIGIAPTKINTIFEKDFSIYDERVMAINSTLFHKTYGIGENPFEVNYDESNEYGYGIYFLDEKYSGIGKYNQSRILSIKPNVKKPLIFLNDDGSSFNSNYKEAYDNAVKYDGVKSKDDFNRKMVELGYDSMLISDIHGIHLVLFYNDPKLYELKSDKGN